MKFFYSLVLLATVTSAVQARSMFTAINDARKRANKALRSAADKTMSFSLNDLLGKKKTLPMIITPELMRELGSPAVFEQLQKIDELFAKLFWAEQHDLVAALTLVGKTATQDAWFMQKTLLKNAMVQHAKTATPSSLELTKELVAEEAILAEILNTLVRAADALKNSASEQAAFPEIKALHDRRNKAQQTLQQFGSVLAHLLAI
jgi:hypothetical protein